MPATRRHFLTTAMASVATGAAAFVVGRETVTAQKRPTAAPDGTLAAAAFGVAADGSTDDTDALRAAVDAAQAQSATLRLPLGTMRITGSLEIERPMTLAGAAAYVLWGSQNDGFDTIDLPLAPPYLAGSVILVDAEDVDGLRLTGAGLHANLRDFGIRFARPFSRTGHGVVAEPPQLSSGGRDNGLQGATWERLAVHGHDGDHYAYRLVNPIYASFRDLRGFGGGLLSVEDDSSGSDGHYGNCVFAHIYGQLHVAGSAHGIQLIDPQGRLNLLCFVRPQVSTTDKSKALHTTPPHRSQHIFHADPGVRSVSILAPDFESNVGGTCQLGEGPGWFVDVGGRISDPRIWDVMTGSVTAEQASARLRSDMTFTPPPAP